MRKRIISIFLIVCLLCIFCACSKKNEKNSVGTKEPISTNKGADNKNKEFTEKKNAEEKQELTEFQLLFKNGPLLVSDENYLWGYINETGSYVIEPAFSRACPFNNDGYATVKDEYSQLWGMIDRFGDYYIEPIFAGLGNEFSEGLLPAKDPEAGWGYIDESGEFVIEPMYTYAEKFSGGKARVSMVDFGVVADVSPYTYLIDKNGNELEDPGEPEDNEVPKRDGITDPESGLCRACVKDETGETKYVFVNEENEIVLPKTKVPYEQAGDFSEGLALVCDSDGTAFGYIDTEGNWAIEPQFIAANEFQDEIAVVGKIFDEGAPEKYQVIDKSGNCIWEFDEYELLGGSYSGERIPVSRYLDDEGISKVGFYDKEGNMIIDHIFDKTKGIAKDSSYAKVSYEGYWGIIDKDGNWLIPPEFLSF